MSEPILEIRGLRTQFTTGEGTVLAADDVSLSVPDGGTLGLVGESGCGKTVTALSVLRLVEPPGRITGGEILFRGRDLLKLPEEELRRIRGRRIALIFQEPMSALDPVFTVGEQICETVRLHLGLSRRAARERAIELLGKVGIPAPESRADSYPHQLSGGMRQRAMIALALCCDPELLIADEPTTALDAILQAQILDLLRALQQERRMAMLLITHDLGVVAQTCDQVAVMSAGRVVERAPVEQLFRSPSHPYTAKLVRSIQAFAPRLLPVPG